MSSMDRPYVGIALVLVREGRVLLGERRGEHAVGTWGCPGGHLEHGESWEECAARECEEETGLVPARITFWTATNDIFESGKHYVTLFMIGETSEGEPAVREPDKHAQWSWFEWESMPENTMLPIRNLLKNGYNPLTK